MTRTTFKRVPFNLELAKKITNVEVKGHIVTRDGHSWHTYIPIPWLWKKIYHNHPEFNAEQYTLVDFLL